MESADQFLQMFTEWEKHEDSGLALTTGGATEGLKQLRELVNDSSQSIRSCAALMIEEVILKASSLSESERKNLCSKMQQWIAGSKWAVTEDDIHPVLLMFCRDHS